MTYVINTVRAQNWKDLNCLSMEFSQRLTQMTGASIQGFRQRLSRIGHQCSEKTAEDLMAIFRESELAGIPITQAKLVSECSDFYIEEIRNGQQIVRLTFDEMGYWAGRFTQVWSKLLSNADPQ